MAARDGTGIDLLLGVGGTPEAIIAACALKCLGGVIQGQLCAARRRGARARRSMPVTTSTACSPPTTWCPPTTCSSRATGITDGELMARGQVPGGGATTHSLVMRSRSGTIRRIESEHQLSKLRAYSSVNFG